MVEGRVNMKADSSLRRLAELIESRNAVEREIAEIVGRPGLIGHVGEYVASEIFGIELLESASHRAIDGHFTDGALAGRSVNVKWYTRDEGLLDITPKHLPDYYLVLAGPRTAAASSRGATRPWAISSVFLFDTRKLMPRLKARGIKIGTATGVARHYWDDAEVYPTQASGALALTTEQRAMIEMFGES